MRLLKLLPLVIVLFKQLWPFHQVELCGETKTEMHGMVGEDGGGSLIVLVLHGGLLKILIRITECGCDSGNMFFEP